MTRGSTVPAVDNNDMIPDDRSQSGMCEPGQRHRSPRRAIPLAPSLGEQFREIMRDMDPTYAGIRAAGYPPITSPEHVVLEAVYTRLRAWNERSRQQR